MILHDVHDENNMNHIRIVYSEFAAIFYSGFLSMLIVCFGNHNGSIPTLDAQREGHLQK